MIIYVYPSRLEGEPLETHRTDHPGTFADWLRSSDIEFDATRSQPISAELNGAEFPVSEWDSTRLPVDAVVRLYPEVKGLEGWALTAVVIAVIGAAVSIYMVLSMPKLSTSAGEQGSTLNTDGARANSAEVNGVIREVLGTRQVYPDYLVPPRKRFVTPRELESFTLLSVGVGEYDLPAGSIRIGDTPIGSFGTDAQFASYAPGASLAADPCAENWYPCSEVGGTAAGSAGLNLASSMPSGDGADAEAIYVSGTTLTLQGDSAVFPDNWVVGQVVRVSAPQTYQVALVGSYSRISGDFAEVVPFVGMAVSVAGDESGDYVVAAYSPAVAAVPGVGGSPSAAIGSAAPSTYNFSSTPAVWTLTYGGTTYTLTLNANYSTMSGLISALTTQLSGSGLVAQDSSGRVRIVEPSSPYKGGAISMASPPVSVFGATVTYTTGTASSGGTPGQAAYVELNFPTGGAVASFAAGSRRLCIGYRGLRYQINAISSSTLTLARLNDAGTVDSGWPGFTARSIADFELNSSVASATPWIGPFLACPVGELTSKLEYDIFFPQGIAQFNKKGRRRQLTLGVYIEWRDSAVGGAWTSIFQQFTESTRDQLGYTFTIDLPYPMRPEVRMRRQSPPGNDQTLDAINWFGLRAKLDAPTSYSGITVVSLRLRGSDRLSAQSDRKVNLVASRRIGGQPVTLSGAALYVTDSLGIPRSEVDEVTLANLQASYWTPRGETYDAVHGSMTTARDVLAGIFAAGMSHLKISGGKVSAVREGISNYCGTFTPHDMASPLQAKFTAPSPDDFDGVDVEYTDSATWSVETVECRLPGSLGLKVEKLRLEGVTDRTRAWRLGMRQTRKYAYQRWAYSFDTELDGLCFEYLDTVLLSDDIPGFGQSALITAVEVVGDRALLTVDELFDWSVDAPRCAIRRHDATATALLTPTRVGGYVLSVPASAIDFEIVTDWSIEPARVLFGPSSRIGYPAMLNSIDPSGDGTCAINCAEYNPVFYADDDNSPE